MVDNKQQIRVRFAPSPTGHLHIGGVRTAIFNWLFARHNDGAFLVRIEDTDRQRSKQEYTDSILGALSWLGINPDEAIVIQSDRDAEHKKLIQKLLDDGKAYKCYCSLEDIVARIGHQEHQKYDGFCKTRQTADTDKPFVVRFAVPRSQPTISFQDLIRDTVTFDNDQFDDFIIARSDGAPTYNFVVVIDDHAMNISHVIRGEDHISNTPKQIMLYDALGFTPPAFAHIPLILGPSGNRLSKRDGATSVLEYKKLGYLPDALLNYLVRLGWAHGDQEIFNQSEMIDYFTLDGVGKKGSIFDQKKLDWLNGIYIRQLSSAELLAYIQLNLEPNWRKKLSNLDDTTLYALIDLYKQRAKRVTDIIEGLSTVSNAPTTYNKEAIEKWISPETKNYLASLIESLGSIDFSRVAIEQAIKQLCEKHAIKISHIAQPIRIALTGSTISPGVYDLLTALGDKESLVRLKAFKKFLNE